MIKKRFPFFSFNNKRKHPAYVFKEKNGKYSNILITHSAKDKKRKNIPLYKNPNPKDNSKAYVHKKIYIDDKKMFGRSFKNWTFHRNDKRIIKRLKNNKKK